ncbi:MAG: hypothetical protein ACYTEQ_10320, partial [Planctomycetota bacterium]
CDNRIEGNNVTDNDRGIDVDDSNNIIIKNTASGNTGRGGSPSAHYDIAANNSYGPIINVSGVGDISATTGADHPWANFQF